MKKIFALVLAMLLVLGMTAAFATEDPEAPAAPTTGSINLTGGKAGHTYTLYQIFVGQVNGTELTNIQWGNGVTDAYKATFATAAAAAKSYEGGDAREIAQALIAGAESTSYLTNGTPLTLTEDGNVTFNNLAKGYYVITDTNANATVTENDYSSALIVKLVGDVTGALKADKPSSEKKVLDKNDSATDAANEAEVYQDSADYDIGDPVPFQLKATTANNVAAYKKYHITFQDKQSAGLNEPTSWTVTVLGKTFNVTTTENPDSQTTTNGTKITVQKVAADADQTFAIKVTFEPTGEGVYLNAECNRTDIYVNYNAVLNENAEIGSAGNPNTSYIKYSNNPESTDDHEEGKTPEDKVKVFTYKTVVDKIDAEGNDLNGAAFTLYKVKDTYTLPTSGTNDEKNTAIAAASESIVSTKVISAENDKHTFSFEGLDDGTYVLCETTTPTGYNTMVPVLFTISATHDAAADDPQLLTLTATTPFTENNLAAGTVTRKNGTTHSRESGEAYAEIENNSGSTLPSTGGVGTTIFYIAGSILVLAAVIFMVTKRRMNANND